MTGVRRKKVILGMSGGVDSSVAALLLKEHGYDVKGISLKLWAYRSENPCCSTEDIQDAALIAKQLRMDFEVLDMQEQFRHRVVEYYIREMTAGRTPNPCIVCNDHIKFGLLLDYALSNRYDYVATGHYARVYADAQGYHLAKAADRNKDQSYFLFMLDQKRLPLLLFPLGELDKNTVREIARKGELLTCTKKESQELCFLPAGGFGEFSRTYLGAGLTGGKIVNRDGTSVGTHRGLPFYTIGQRRGIGVYTNTPVYVIGKNVFDNSIMVDGSEGLMADTCTLKDVHWTAGKEPGFPLHANARIRYRHKEAKAEIRKKDDMLTVQFALPQRAITPGQAVVFYDGDEVLGGGWIQEVKR